MQLLSFIAFTALLDRSVIRYIIAIFLAFLFHKSAIIFWAFLPLTFGDLTKSRTLFFSIILIPISVGLTQTESFAVYLMLRGSGGFAEDRVEQFSDWFFSTHVAPFHFKKEMEENLCR